MKGLCNGKTALRSLGEAVSSFFFFFLLGHVVLVCLLSSRLFCGALVVPSDPRRCGSKGGIEGGRAMKL